MSYLLYLFSFIAGVGIQVPFVQLYGNLSLADIIILFVLPIILIKRGRIVITRPAIRFALILGLLGIWSTIALAFSSGWHLENLGPIVRLFYYAAIVLCFGSALRDIVSLQRLAQFFLLGLGVNIGVMIYLWNLQPVYWDRIPLLNTPLFNRNILYYYCIFGLALVLGSQRLLWSGNYRLLGYVIAGVLTLIGFLTFSRGAWIFILILWAWQLLARPQRAIPSVAIAGIVAIALFINMGVQYHDLTGRIDSRLNLTTARERLQFVNVGLNMGLDYPFAGVGPRNFRHYGPDYGVVTIDPHNVPVMLFAETGVFGLALYFTLWSLIIWYILTIWLTPVRNPIITPHRTSITLLAFVLFGLNWLTGMAFTDKIFPFFLIYLSGTVMTFQSEVRANGPAIPEYTVQAQTA